MFWTIGFIACCIINSEILTLLYLSAAMVAGLIRALAIFAEYDR